MRLRSRDLPGKSAYATASEARKRGEDLEITVTRGDPPVGTEWQHLATRVIQVDGAGETVRILKDRNGDVRSSYASGHRVG